MVFARGLNVPTDFIISDLLLDHNPPKTLAEMAGIPQAAVSRFDKSIQHKDEHLFRISHALGVPIEELFDTVLD
ncbi:hypothetical protein PCURB6_42100 [Paenibacillus curdlanolyticus]|nr:hypothetical protein PCURB6_42100 [Paenibacillus curdlanolyticus]